MKTNKSVYNTLQYKYDVRLFNLSHLFCNVSMPVVHILLSCSWFARTLFLTLLAGCCLVSYAVYNRAALSYFANAVRHARGSRVTNFLPALPFSGRLKTTFNPLTRFAIVRFSAHTAE